MTQSDRECPLDIVNALIEVEQRDQPCWRVSKVLGSMLVFDLGGRVPRTLFKGGEVEVGTSILTVRDVYWTFKTPSGLEACSDDVTRDDVAAMQSVLGGATLAGCERQPEDLIVRFSTGAFLALDLTNVHAVDADEEIAELQLSGGVHLELTHDGRFLLNVLSSVREKVAA